MSLRETIRKKSASLVKRETVHLPDLDVDVQVRGLMLGEVNRITDQEGTGKQSATQIALSVEDPETSKPIWNANLHEDMEEIAGLTMNDAQLIITKGSNLSGIGKKAEEMGKETSSGGKNSSTSSRGDSEGLSPN